MKRLLLIACVLLPLQAEAAFSFVQTKSAGSGGAGPATSIALTMDSALTTGNMLACGVTWGSGTTTDLSSVTDGTNTYTIQQTTADGGNNQSFGSVYTYNVTGSPTVITANFAASLAYRGISCMEFSGELTSSDPIDGANFAQRLQSPCTSCTATAGTLTPSANDFLVVVTSVNTGAEGGGGSEFTAATNFTEPAGAEHSTAGNISLSSTYWIQTTATGTSGPITATVNVNHITGVMIFEVAGGAPAVTCGRLTLLGVGC